MKTKITAKGIKSSIIVCFFMLLFNFLFSMLAFLLIFYWAIPNLSTIFPTLKAYFESLDEEIMPVVYDIVYLISACIAVFPGTTLAYRIAKTRKKEFLAYSKGRISYADGIRYHLAEYGACDILCTSCIIILLAITYMLAGDVFIVRFFPLAFNLFKSLGIVLGFLVTAILTGLSMLCGVLFSQKKWRARYFLGE